MSAPVVLGYAEGGGCPERKKDRTQNKVDPKYAPGTRLARTRNVSPPATRPSSSPASAGGLLLGGYLNPASRDAGTCVERAADPLNSGGVNPEPCSDPAHALCASRLVQSLADSLD